MFNKLLHNKAYEDSSRYFEQYKLYVSSADKISDRRYIVNRFFILLNTVLIAVFNFLKIISLEVTFFVYILIGILICLLWSRTLSVYQIMNEVKFEIIQNIEKKLPLSLYYTEWVELKNRKNKYFQFSKLESIVPYLFILVYVYPLIVPVLYKK